MTADELMQRWLAARAVGTTLHVRPDLLPYMDKDGNVVHALATKEKPRDWYVSQALFDAAKCTVRS